MSIQCRWLFSWYCRFQRAPRPSRPLPPDILETTDTASGDILAFVTGQLEVETCVQRLQDQAKRRPPGPDRGGGVGCAGRCLAARSGMAASVDVLGLYGKQLPEDQAKTLQPATQGTPHAPKCPAALRFFFWCAGFPLITWHQRSMGRSWTVPSQTDPQGDRSKKCQSSVWHFALCAKID